jgi:hypothetical protein
MVKLDDPATWPLADILPLTRDVPGDLWPELGVMVAGRPGVVFLASAFEPGVMRRLAWCERVEYPDAEAVSKDGWQVD